MLMGLMVVGCGTFALCVLEPQLDFGRLLFEQISAYSTAGLSTGITAELPAEPPLGEDGPYLLHQHKKRCGLDAAARRARRCAYEH